MAKKIRINKEKLLTYRRNYQKVMRPSRHDNGKVQMKLILF